MATLNLGRVRINFRGDFESLHNETLVWYDAVTFRGSLYLVLAKELKVAVGDYGNNPTLSGNDNNYLLLAKGISYGGEWEQGKTYYENEIVKYGGSTYIALKTIPKHLDTPQRESINKTGYWVELASGIGRYVPGYDGSIGLTNTDMVTWKSTLYMAIEDTAPSQTPTTDPDKFDVIASGINPAGQWNSMNLYSFRDTVIFHGCSYVVINELGTAKQPLDSFTGNIDPDWELLSKGLNFVGPYDPIHSGYYPGDVVTHQQSVYSVISKTHAGESPQGAPSKYTKIISSSSIMLEDLINIDSTGLTNGSILQYEDGMWKTINHIEDTGDLSISGGIY